MELADRVRQLRTEKKLTQAELADLVTQLGGSLSQTQVGAIEAGESKRPRCLPELALALETTPEWLLGRGGPLAKDPPPIKPQLIKTVPLQPGAINLPVYGCTEIDGGAWLVDPSPINMVERPPSLRYSASAFGIYCNGTQQAPAFEPGDMVMVDPSRPVKIGDDAVFVSGFSISDIKPFTGILRRLLAQSDTHWHVRQFTPSKDYRVTKTDWPRALYVAGKMSR